MDTATWKVKTKELVDEMAHAHEIGPGDVVVILRFVGAVSARVEKAAKAPDGRLQVAS